MIIYLIGTNDIKYIMNSIFIIYSPGLSKVFLITLSSEDKQNNPKIVNNPYIVYKIIN